MQSRLLNFILAIVSVRWIVVNINRSFFFFTTKPLFLIILSTIVGVWCGDIYLLFISPNLTVIFEENIQWIHTQSQTNAVVTGIQYIFQRI